MNSASDTAVVAYVASPHEGYLRFFRQYPGAWLYVLGNQLIEGFKPLYRHLPGNQPEDAAKMIEALGIFERVSVLNPLAVGILRNWQTNRFARIVMPDEDVSHAFAEQYLPGAPIVFDDSWRLRWDWGASTMNRDPEPNGLISLAAFDRKLIRSARHTAERASDWWRQVGALLVRDGEVLLTAFNRHVPHEQSAYLLGDPRSNFDPGQGIDVSASLHAEAGVIAEAARRGIGTEGCDLYITTFPCPPCAYLCAHAGLGRLYYAEGYSLIAGADVLRAKGVELIRVLFSAPPP